jgi:hypothetical protein
MVFQATLFKVPGKGGWTFAPVPEAHAPTAAGAWGRAPVVAVVDGQRWRTSVWRDRTHGWLLAVPAKIRRGKSHGDVVEVSISADLEPR